MAQSFPLTPHPSLDTLESILHIRERHQLLLLRRKGRLVLSATFEENATRKAHCAGRPEIRRIYRSGKTDSSRGTRQEQEARRSCDGGQQWQRIEGARAREHRVRQCRGARPEHRR